MPDRRGPCTGCQGFRVPAPEAMCEANAVSSIQVADQTFVAAPPASAVDTLADRANWRRWWPDLQLTVVEDRGEKGFRWTVVGRLTGTSEVWLEEVMDGFILHYFLHCEPADPTAPSPDAGRAYYSWLAAENKRRRVAGKAMSFQVRDRLDRDREPGESPRHTHAAEGATS